MKKIIKVVSIIILSLLCVGSCSAFIIHGADYPVTEIWNDPISEWWDTWKSGTDETKKYIIDIFTKFPIKPIIPEFSISVPDTAKKIEDEVKDKESYTIPTIYRYSGSASFAFTDGHCERNDIYINYDGGSNRNLGDTNNYITITNTNFTNGYTWTHKFNVSHINFESPTASGYRLEIYYYDDVWDKVWKSIYMYFKGSDTNTILYSDVTNLAMHNKYFSYLSCVYSFRLPSGSIASDATFYYFDSSIMGNNNNFITNVKNYYIDNDFGKPAIKIIPDFPAGETINNDNSETYNKFGFDISPDLKLSFDPDVFAGLLGKLFDDFKADFDSTYSNQPAPTQNYNTSADRYNYITINNNITNNSNGGNNAPVTVDVNVEFPTLNIDPTPYFTVPSDSSDSVNDVSQQFRQSSDFVHGCFMLADRIFNNTGFKPVLFFSVSVGLVLLAIKKGG